MYLLFIGRSVLVCACQFCNKVINRGKRNAGMDLCASSSSLLPHSDPLYICHSVRWSGVRTHTGLLTISGHKFSDNDACIFICIGCVAYRYGVTKYVLEPTQEVPVCHPSHIVPLPALVTKAQQPSTMHACTENRDSLRSGTTSFSSHTRHTTPCFHSAQGCICQIFTGGRSEFRLTTSDYSGHGGCQIGTVE